MQLIFPDMPSQDEINARKAASSQAFQSYKASVLKGNPNLTKELEKKGLITSKKSPLTDKTRAFNSAALAAKLKNYVVLVPQKMVASEKVIKGYNKGTEAITTLTSGALKAGTDVFTKGKVSPSTKEKLKSAAKTAVKTAGDFLKVMAENAASSTKRDEFYRRLTPALQNQNIYIALPLKPENLNFNFSHSWSMENEAITEVGGQLAQAAGNLLEGKTGGAIDNVVKALGIKGKMALAKKLAGPLAAAGVSTFTPQRQVYKGMSPISLTFSWTLSPESEKEAKTLKAIIHTFNILSSPQKTTGSEAPPYFRTMPALWKVVFNNEGDSKNLIVDKNEFPAMVCKSVQVQYGDGENLITFRDGFPNVISLQVEMEEFFAPDSMESRFGNDAWEQLKTYQTQR